MHTEGFDRQRWAALCRRLGCPDAVQNFEALRVAYAQPHRHYHDVRHIAECLALFDELRDDCDHPDEVEYAIWMHDVVYEPRRSDNEARSAYLAVAWLAPCDVDGPVLQRVRNLVLATRHDGAPATRDEEIIVDIDLHILGADADRFDEYEAQVRREYRRVPWFLYRRRRADILRGFLARVPLYRTERCRARSEERARANLRRSIERLTGRA